MNGVDEPILDWSKPGAGCWEWDPGHFPGALTPLYQAILFPTAADGFGTVFARLGLPLRTLEWRAVNGKVYRRLMPLVMPEREPVPMPTAILKVVLRTMPEMRRRERAASEAFASRFWRAEAEHWYHVERPRYRRRNEELQSADVAALGDEDLADHLREAVDHAVEACRRHFELHGADFTPMGDLIAHAQGWGLDPAEVVGVLAGASPASAAAADSLAELADAVRGRFPGSLEDVRAISPAASKALDAYLDEFGWRQVTTYDIDGRTLGELPDVVLSSILAAAEPRPTAGADTLTARLRAAVPEAEQATFDQVVAEARAAYGLRDDNSVYTIQWPTGLVRRAVLEVGRRLHERDLVHDPRHAVELELAEMTGLLLQQQGPQADATAARAAHRAEMAEVTPPAMLGKPEAEPPESALPEGMARSVRVLKAVIGYVDAAPDGEPMAGTGVGTEPYRGTVRKIDHQREDIFADFEAGDVLVAPFTTPAYNTLLFVAGAVVCEVGGPLSHAAVMARELGIPAVVGAAGVMSQLDDGDTVEVDPVAGTVTKVEGTI